MRLEVHGGSSAVDVVFERAYQFSIDGTPVCDQAAGVGELNGWIKRSTVTQMNEILPLVVEEELLAPSEAVAN